MPKHEAYLEICAAASIGQATPEELAKLERHVAECAECRQAYRDYLAVAAQQFAAARPDAKLSPVTAQECLNSDLVTRRFFERAEQAGILFSPDAEEDANKFTLDYLVKGLKIPKENIVIWSD